MANLVSMSNMSFSYFEPLRRKPIEPLRGKTIEPLRRKTIEPLRGKTIEALRGKTIEPLRGKPIEPLRGKPIEPLRGKPIEPLRGKPITDTKLLKQNTINKPIEPLRRKTIEPLPGKTITDAKLLKQNTIDKTIEPLRGKTITDAELVEQNMGVYTITDNHVCTVYSNDLDPCVNVSRFSVRKLTRQSNIGRFRDREPSRIPVKKIMQVMRKIKNRPRIKQIIRRSTPKSSMLNALTNNYKDYYIRFVHRLKMFTDQYFQLKHAEVQMRDHRSQSAYVNNGYVDHEFMTRPDKCNFCDNMQYCVSDKKLLMSGDIELNPGPVPSNNNPVGVTSNQRLEERLQHFQMRPFDVGGGGDCFFRAVSHQLYGDPSYHLDIRAAGIVHMRENPDRFIESNTDYSWLQYLNTMSMQGTWADHLIIQAVANQLNLRIIITETHERFRQHSLI